MLRSLLLFFFINSIIFANNFETAFQATVDADESIILEKCVNLITGQLYLNDVDIIAEGKEPIFYSKSYTSLFSHYSLDDLINRWGEFEDARNIGWGSDKHLMAYIGFDNERHKEEVKRVNRRIDIYEPNGIMQSYEFFEVKAPKNKSWQSKKKKKTKKEKFEAKKASTKTLKLIENQTSYQKNITNAKDNHKNTSVIAFGEHDLQVESSDNTIRRYYRKDAGFGPYTLQWEILPNGNKIEYILHGDELREIKSKSPSGRIFSWIRLNESCNDQGKKIHIRTSSGKNIEYGYRNEKKKKEKNNNSVLRYKKSHHLNETFQYHEDKNFLLKSCTYPKNRIFHIDYYTNKKEKNFKRISELKSHIGKSQDLKTIYQINYEKIAKLNKSDGQTSILDTKGNETKFYFNKNLKLEKVEKYENKNNQIQLKNFERIIWGESNQKNFLFGKIYYDENRNPIKAIKNTYDTQNKGNIVKKVIYGNISGKCNSSIELDINTGLPRDNGIETYETTYSYTNTNLIKSETDQNGLKTEYTYLIRKDFETTLPLTKFVIFNGEIKQRCFYTYNNDNILIEEIEDNGSSTQKNDFKNATQRLIKKIKPRAVEPYGLIDTLEEYYFDFDRKQEDLLKKEIYEYSKSCKVTKKHVYGSDNKWKYTITYEYDGISDNLIFETDPLNQNAQYQYDENNNKIYEKDFKGNETYFEYDFCNRLISKTIKNKEEKYFEEYEYDVKHNKVLKRDIYGNEKRYEHDVFGNITKKISPKIEDPDGNVVFATKSYKYDSFGRQTEKTDPNKNTIKTKYNILNKPIHILYPDNTFEEFEYFLDGCLKSHVNRVKTKTEYQYDQFQRVLSKKIISSKDILLSEELFEYDSFNLISKTDSENRTIAYTYDGAGRKIKEEIFSKDQKLLFKKEFFYDSLGFLCKSIEADILVTINLRDNIGRVIKETHEDLDSNQLRKIKYQYNDKKNEITTISFISGKKSKEIKTFDMLDRLIKIEDATANVTTYENNRYFDPKLKQKVNQITQINPLKQKIITTYDAIGREKAIEHINPEEKRVSFEEKYYDLNGNLKKQVSSIYSVPNTLSKKVNTLWDYDNFNRVIAIIEAQQSAIEKITRYEYLDLNLMKKVIKPDGNEIISEYDELGNTQRIYSNITNPEDYFDPSISSDIDYQFTYNKLNQPIKAFDNINATTNLREYDPLGHLIQEELSNGLLIKNEYDLIGNKIKTTFPDNSYVKYIYDSLNLKKITRNDPNGKPLYEHNFLEYDLSGNLIKEKLIDNAGYIDYEIDLLGQTTSIKTDYHTQKIIFDKIGKISKINYEGFTKDKNLYKHDDLNQIKNENGLFNNSYLFDSHNNRLSKNTDLYLVNDLNQIQSTKDNTFEYDKNGNLISQTTSDGKICYFYDTLDRLIRIEKPNNDIFEFGYDAFNRRISKTSKYNSWLQFDDLRYFLYDNQNEIGSYDKYLTQKDLRILSDTRTAEIGSAISFELDGYVYAPIYDVSGNVISLIYNGSLYEHYRYSAFGERKIYSSSGNDKKESQISNPWQFSSKRIDEESNLIYFGRRYYDPKLGRWLTPDPKGFIDGLNLYAFVANDPLINVDLYGLMLLPPLMLNSYQTNNRYFPENSSSSSNRPTKFKEFTKEAINSLFGLSQAQKIIFNFDPSREISIKSNEFLDGRNIGAIFGIRTTSQEAKEYAKIISDYAGGKNIHLLHNETRGGLWDGLRAGYELISHRDTKSVRMQREIWTYYLSKSNRNYLHICQSEGAIITRNALEGMPQALRRRIDIVAIAPAAYIDRHLCHSRSHYVSRDFVPYFDFMGYIRNKDSIIKIKPHPNAKFPDHNFDSPSFNKPLRFHIKKDEQ